MIHLDDASPSLSLVHSPELTSDVLCRDGAMVLSHKTEADTGRVEITGGEGSGDLVNI